jgi:uncharacterized protein YrrD
MRFKEGAPVYSADARQVGSVDRVVVDADTREITHVIVREGLLFTRDKLVPIDFVQEAGDDQVTLNKVVDEIQALRDFEESHYVPAERKRAGAGQLLGEVQSLFLYPPRSVTWWGPSEILDSPAQGRQPRYVRQKLENLSRGQVALEEGARVFDADGKQVGNVAEVVFDPESDRITHLVIARGLLLRTEKLVPSNWIKEIGEKEVRLTVGAQYLRALKTGEAEPEG